MANNPPQDKDTDIVIGEERIPGQYQDIGLNDQQSDLTPTDIGNDEVEISNPISQVASAPAKNILIIGVLVIVSVIFLYKFIFKESDKVTAEKQLKAEIASQPVTEAKPATQQEGAPQVNIGVVDTPELPAIADNLQALPPPSIPDLPAFQAPEPIKELEIPSPATPTPTPIPTLTPVPEPVKVETPAAAPIVADDTTEDDSSEDLAPAGPTPEQIRAKEVAKRKTGMLIMNGGGTPADVLSGKANNTKPGKSAAPQVTATKVDDLSLMILQGKMIDAVLETTLNTDLPGSLRAVISRDIYAEAGKNILIPHGSRLIGTYNNGIQIGQQRVIISWGRVIRPDGVDIDIASSGTDQLGRSGMSGIVDNKYLEMFSNSLLVSAVTIGSSIFLNKINPASPTTSSTTANTDGSTTATQTGNPTDLSVLQSAQSLTDQAGKIAAQLANTNPTIIINQGARIKVFVNKDLVFPASVVNKVNSSN